MSSRADGLSRAGNAIKANRVVATDHGDSSPLVMDSADPVIVLDSAGPVIVLDSADPVIVLDSADPVSVSDFAEPAPVVSAPEMHVSSPLARLISLGARKPRPALLEQLSKAAKRAIDIVLASVLLTISMPVMVAAAAAVRLTSPGPILYSQERTGYKGRSFEILKFRSMVSDADQLIPEMARLAEGVDGLKTTDAPMFKSADDPRITRVGRLLRRTGIDELPQFFNVLAGDMSLVGPRPLVPEEAATLAPLAAERRASVRPGLTCLWQVLREEDTSFSERMQLDLLYVNHRSLLLDFSLIALTPAAIAGGNGSY